MVLVCPPGHRLASRTSVNAKDLAKESYIGFEKGLVIRRQVDRFLREQGVSVDVVLEFDNIENIKEAVEVGAGVALLPKPTLLREVKSGALAAVPLAEPGMVRPMGVIIRRHARLSLAAHRFMELLKDSGNNGGKARATRPTRGNNLPALGQGGNGRTGATGFRTGRAS
jgi:DNA-binding transcriptional LysR family regulator